MQIYDSENVTDVLGHPLRRFRGTDNPDLLPIVTIELYLHAASPVTPTVSPGMFGLRDLKIRRYRPLSARVSISWGPPGVGVVHLPFSSSGKSAKVVAMLAISRMSHWWARLWGLCCPAHMEGRKRSERIRREWIARAANQVLGLLAKGHETVLATGPHTERGSARHAEGGGPPAPASFGRLAGSTGPAEQHFPE